MFAPNFASHSPPQAATVHTHKRRNSFISLSLPRTRWVAARRRIGRFCNRVFTPPPLALDLTILIAGSVVVNANLQRRNGERFARAVRSHWSIENTLHWSLDMTFREDESRVRERTFADNLSWLRRMTLSLIKQHPGKESNIMKRRVAGWSIDYLMQILTGKGT